MTATISEDQTTTEPPREESVEQATAPTQTMPERLAELGRMLAFEAELKSHIARKRAELNNAMVEVRETTGSKSFSHSFGPKAAVTFSLRDSDDTIVVGNEREFLDWVMENHPDEVVTEFAVTEAFRKALLARATPFDHDEPTAGVVDPDSGVFIAGLKFIRGGKGTKSNTAWSGNGKEKALNEVFGSSVLELMAPTPSAASAPQE